MLNNQQKVSAARLRNPSAQLRQSAFIEASFILNIHVDGLVYLEKIGELKALANPPPGAQRYFSIIGQCFPRHRHQEFLRFLRQLDDEFPEKLKLHLVLDNYGTHKHPKVQSWLQRHPRFTLHFIPTSSSWLNQVERWFGELTQKAVRRGAFISVAELEQAIQRFLQAWNEAPRPFVWTATVEKIMAKVERARQKLEEIKPGWSVRKKRKKRRKHV